MRANWISLIKSMALLFLTFSPLANADVKFIQIAQTLASGNMAAWADVDQDDDLDIAIVTSTSTKFYRNNGNQTFTASDIDIGTGAGAVRWGDIDNDGDLDLFVSGNIGAGWFTHILRNNGSTFTVLNESTTGLPNLTSCSAAFGDYDNDGDDDLLVIGSVSATAVMRIYRSNGDGTFTDINAGLPGADLGKVDWKDMDGDNDLDIAVCGGQTTVFRNNSNASYTNLNPGIPNLTFCDIKWGDYDGDLKLDLVLGGQLDSNEHFADVYHNNNDGTFSRLNLSMPSPSSPGFDWGDFDGDTKLDFIYTGIQGAGSGTYIFRNFGDGTFDPSSAGTSSVSILLSTNQIEFGDMDNDGDLDLLLANGHVFRNVPVHSISGNVTYQGSPLEGVSVAISGVASGSANTNSQGNYLFSGIESGAYNFIPSKDNLLFSPSNRSLVVTTSDLSGINFIATAPTPTATTTPINSPTPVPTSSPLPTSTPTITPTPDSIPPIVQAKRGNFRAGRKILLRWNVFDASGSTSEKIRLLKGSKSVGKASSAFSIIPDDGRKSLTFNAKKLAAGSYQFCITSTDATKNRSPESCAKLVLK